MHVTSAEFTAGCWIEDQPLPEGAFGPSNDSIVNAVSCYGNASWSHGRRGKRS